MISLDLSVDALACNCYRVWLLIEKWYDIVDFFPPSR